MSSISGINSQNAYTALVTGSKINSAADNAAGLAINEQLELRETGYTTGASNAAAGQDLLNVADGALSTIQDSLQRIRELSVQAANDAVYSPSDISAMQKEIDGLKQSIQNTAKNTSFNTLKLLDGSMADLNLATNPQGGGIKIQLVNSTLESLGIADYDVTKNFNLNDIDNAIQKISDARSTIGAQSNTLDRTINGNKYSAYNIAKAQSSLSDTDYAEEIIEKNKEQALEKYRMFTLKAKTENEANVLKLFQ